MYQIKKKLSSIRRKLYAYIISFVSYFCAKKSSDSVVIDFSGAKTIDSVGIGLIIALYNSISKQNRDLKIINMTKSIYELFKMMRLDKVLTIEKEKI